MLLLHNIHNKHLSHEERLNAPIRNIALKAKQRKSIMEAYKIISGKEARPGSLN